CSQIFMLGFGFFKFLSFLGKSAVSAGEKLLPADYADVRRFLCWVLDFLSFCPFWVNLRYLREKNYCPLITLMFADFYVVFWIFYVFVLSA
ncbi:hypothetical protein MM236_18040, partial [Belliella sp. DSM 107340]